MVVDAGENRPGFNAGNRYMLPLLKYYGINRIKYLVGSHAHSDHIGGFTSILSKIIVDTLVLPHYPYESRLYQSILSTAKRKKIPVVYKARGDKLYPDETCRVYVLHPLGRFLTKHDQSGHEVNNSSLVLKITYRETAFLLTGDMEMDAEKYLLNYRSFLGSDLLKVGHHGSKTSTGEAFLTLIHPDYSVISVGRFNKFFHPSRNTVDRLTAGGAHPLRTDHFGGLVFESDGREVKLVNWRKN
ncbi:MAG: MBL fold metallo-hydrolase [Calditrichaceae bacterium]